MHTFKVMTNQRLTTTTLLLTLQNTDKSNVFRFRPGQYAAINFMRRGRPTVVRCFSIVSSPNDVEILQFGIKIGGRYTKALSELQHGDEVKVHGAFGSFTIDHAIDKKVVLLAGGIGITPFMSLIRYATSIAAETSITLLFSAKDDYDMPFAEELLALEEKNPNFRFVLLNSDTKHDQFASKPILRRRIDEKLLDIATDKLYLDKAFFICGSQGFMDGMVSILDSKGVSPLQITTEAFYGQSPTRSKSLRNWPHTVYGFTLLALILGIAVITGADFVRAMPNYSFGNRGSSGAVSQTTTSMDIDQAQIDKAITATPPQPNDPGHTITLTDSSR